MLYLIVFFSLTDNLIDDVLLFICLLFSLLLLLLFSPFTKTLPDSPGFSPAISEIVRIIPSSLTFTSFFGAFDKDTGLWQDGIFSSIW